MSIPMISKHEAGGTKYLLPTDLGGDEARNVVFQRERFCNVTELLRKLDRIDADDLAEATNKYFITAEHINDAYIAVLAVYWSIAEKLNYVGNLIVFDEEEELHAVGGYPMMFRVPMEAEDEDFMNSLSDERNPIIHTLSSQTEMGSEILLDNRVEFFINCPAANKPNPSFKKLEGCCRCVAIDSGKSEDAKAILTDYFYEKDYEWDGVEKEIDALVHSIQPRNEYVITAAARQVVSNHLFGDESERELLPEDFKGVAALFSARKPKRSSKSKGLIGLERETAKINGILNSVSIDKLRYDKGISDSFNGCSMVFAGPPGTAKTTLARKFAARLEELGIIKSSSCFKECVKSDIVGQYVGHTAAKVDRLFGQMSKNGGGVIFFDEIYTLSESDSTIYDKEAVTSITQNMENYRGNVFCIFAGYENKMNEFLECNPGLRSRMSFTVKFEGYSNETLCEIFRSIAASDNFKIPRECEDVLCSFFKRLRSARGAQFGNGREARNLFVNAKQKLALRIGASKRITSKMLTTLEPEDISEAAEDILSSELEGGGKHKVIGF